MSRRVQHVLAVLLLLSAQSVPVLAADSSQVNFKIFSPPGSESPKEDSAEQASSQDGSGSTAADSSGTSTDSAGAAASSSTDSAAAASSSSTSSDTAASSSETESMWTEGDAATQAPPGGTMEPTLAQPDPPSSSSSAETPSSASADTTSTSETPASTDSGSESKVLQGYIRVVPSGTKIPIIMDSAVDSDTSQEGDEFAARTSEDLTIDGNTAVPAGSVIKGRIARLNNPRHLNRSGSVALKFDTVTTPDNRQIPLTANLVARGGVVHAKRGFKDIAIDTGTFVAPIGVGTVIGAIAGASNNGSSGLGTAGGLLIGAGIGVAIGTIILCAKKGKRVDVRPGDELKIELAEDLRMPM